MDMTVRIIAMVVAAGGIVYLLSGVIAQLLKQWDDYSERVEAKESQQAERVRPPKPTTRKDVIINAVFFVLWIAVFAIILITNNGTDENHTAFIILFAIFAIIRFISLSKSFRDYRRSAR